MAMFIGSVTPCPICPHARLLVGQLLSVPKMQESYTSCGTIVQKLNTVLAIEDYYVEQNVLPKITCRID